MDNIFSPGRFTQLFVRHTAANYKAYLLSLAMLFGVLFLLITYATIVNNSFWDTTSQSLYFIVFFLLGGTVFTSSIFSDLHDKRKAVSYLTLPASNLEKYLVAWIYSFLVFQLVYIAGFYAVEVLVLNMSSKSAEKPAELLNIFEGSSGFFYREFAIYAILHALAFFGAAFFKRWHFIKTVSLGFAAMLLIMLIHGGMINWMFPEGVISTEPFGGLEINEDGGHYYLKQLPAIKLALPYLMMGLAIILWAGTYFKLKETEV